MQTNIGRQNQLTRGVNELSVMQMELQLFTVTPPGNSRLAGCTKSQIISLINRNIHRKLLRLIIIVHFTLHIPTWSLVMS